MAAEVDLDVGREPAEAPALALGHHEGRLRKIVLGRDRLHRRLVQPGVEGADRGRIAAEHPVGECVDLKQSERHPPASHANQARLRRLDQVSSARPASRSAAATHAAPLRRSPKITAPQPNPVSTTI